MSGVTTRFVLRFHPFACWIGTTLADTRPWAQRPYRLVRVWDSATKDLFRSEGLKRGYEKTYTSPSLKSSQVQQCWLRPPVRLVVILKPPALRSSFTVCVRCSRTLACHLVGAREVPGAPKGAAYAVALPCYAAFSCCDCCSCRFCCCRLLPALKRGPGRLLQKKGDS